jgi:hypothetical protein
VPFDKLWRTGASDCTTTPLMKIFFWGLHKRVVIPCLPFLQVRRIIIVNSDTLHGESGYDEKRIFSF